MAKTIMDPNKLKAADTLTESLKLIVTISTIFFGGLLAYRSNVATPAALWTYYSALGLLALSSILSVLNINSLINKIYRGEDELVKNKEVKGLNIFASLALLLGIAFGAWFLSEQTPGSSTPATQSSTVITDSNILVGKDVTAVINVKKNSSGKIDEVTITPK